MASNNLIAVKYAEALFNVAKKEGKQDVFLKDLEKIAVLLENNKLCAILFNPSISKDELVACLDEFHKKLAVDKNVGNFLLTVGRNSKLTLFGKMVEKFAKLCKNAKNILDVEIITARQMSDAANDNIISNLEERLKQKIIAKTTINKNILGGVVIKVGSKIIDLSVANQLKQIENNLN